ncbi:FecR family protein [Pseudoflavitalea sp. X16]|uniref:FecR family protein n=1 Tax=Paraflavitalea devenefica TaxID=2716334 RepID=UPI0014246668|nr:FecR family protein [Paraflavitalea devenefica]NII23540.1 FecR family protein [Paraflavitalea devenefica]
MNRRAFYHLLQRYSDGTCTDEEKKLVEQWYELLDDDHEPAISEHEIKATVEQLWPVIKEKTLPSPAVEIPERPVRRIPAYVRYISAAAAIAAVALGVYWFTTGSNHVQSFEEEVINEQLSRVENTQETADTVYLPDKTMVVLEPHAKLYYPDSFALAKREVYLEGNAFFKVTRNPKSPFYVYSNNIVTQVLGTSFFVKTDKVTNDVEVSVRTGKVAVYENEAQAKKHTSERKQESAGVILKPNQKVIYNRQDGHFRTSLVDVPLPLVPDNHEEEMVTELNFVFEETPISKVLSHLEKAYHIEIIVENSNLSKCLFSGDIKGQNLYDQLEIICQSVQASYEVRGTQILLKGGADE